MAGIQCSGDHKHVKLIRGRAKETERYPPALDRAIVEGLQKKLKVDRRINTLYAVPLELEDVLHEVESPAPLGIGGSTAGASTWRRSRWLLRCLVAAHVFWDDVCGCILEPAKVREAREAGLAEVDKLKAYRWATLEECHGKHGVSLLAQGGRT